jgi:hypothetical protein
MSESCWTMSELELEGLTPLRARDLVVECFYYAQHETLARTRLRLGVGHLDEASIRASVTGAVRLAFKEAGGDYEHPTAGSLAGAIDVLARKAESWGTPEDIVRHHREQIERMLRRLARAA